MRCPLVPVSPDGPSKSSPKRVILTPRTPSIGRYIVCSFILGEEKVCKATVIVYLILGVVGRTGAAGALGSGANQVGGILLAHRDRSAGERSLESAEVITNINSHGLADSVQETEGR